MLRTSGKCEPVGVFVGTANDREGGSCICTGLSLGLKEGFAVSDGFILDNSVAALLSDPALATNVLSKSFCVTVSLSNMGFELLCQLGFQKCSISALEAHF